MITGNRKDIEVALKSPSNMEDYLSSAPAVQIIADIKAYGGVDRVKIATAAMQGILASYPKEEMVNGRFIAHTEYATLSRCAVGISDALIAELNKPQTTTP